jgi:hypothetical protein
MPCGRSSSILSTLSVPTTVTRTYIDFFTRGKTRLRNVNLVLGVKTTGHIRSLASHKLGVGNGQTQATVGQP